jgi:hypothetical protein
VDGDFSGGFGGGGIANGEPGLAGHAGGRMSKPRGVRVAASSHSVVLRLQK